MCNCNANMDCPKNSIGNFAIALLLIEVVYLCLSCQFQAFQWPQPPTKALEAVPQDDLEAALSKASMPNKTVIITIVNKAYVEGDDTSMLDLFLESFWIGEGTREMADHLLVVAGDQTAYDRCIFRGLHCYKMVGEDGDMEGEKLYMSEDFIKMMWRRTLLLLHVLERGYSFIFTDTDVSWLRNPFPRLTTNLTADLQISTDKFLSSHRPEDNSINTGFYFVRSNNKTIALFQTWYAMKNNSIGKKEQDVLSDLMLKGIFRQLGLEVRALHTLYFSGFCQDSKDFRAVTTVHANCCRSISAKVADLKAVHRDWRRFKAATATNKTVTDVDAATFRWSAHAACVNSWNIPMNTVG
ncbi:Uncharacterized protein CK203_090436 [Vitis vinifera]|uniref:Nucleotide-diphospho-sugar transferase domain-containing protein n=1 Tax=Vitis vinifera TaxID=29760 RepID=A0A438BVI3_VITVI|nr:Uncharacterized protein CK203_090436 [Vitis vinifera]